MKNCTTFFECCKWHEIRLNSKWSSSRMASDRTSGLVATILVALPGLVFAAAPQSSPAQGWFIDVAAASGPLKAATDRGDLHVNGVPHQDWVLASHSGNIRVELPRAARFEIDAAANSGQILIKREDIEQPSTAVSRFRQKVNGGGQRIYVHSGSSKIVVQ
jgi:Toastrack DUF4097